MSNKKKQIRANFRNNVFERDKHLCKVCEKSSNDMDAHHITNRNDMPNGGYVKENGVSLCPGCHVQAEEYLQSGIGIPSGDLYMMIGSSYELAVTASLKL